MLVAYPFVAEIGCLLFVLPFEFSSAVFINELYD